MERMEERSGDERRREEGGEKRGGDLTQRFLGDFHVAAPGTVIADVNTADCPVGPQKPVVAPEFVWRKSGEMVSGAGMGVVPVLEAAASTTSCSPSSSAASSTPSSTLNPESVVLSANRDIESVSSGALWREKRRDGRRCGEGGKP
eukprot:3212511-Rhodomonas_salina.2